MHTVLNPAIRLQQAKLVIYGVIISAVLGLILPMVADLAWGLLAAVWGLVLLGMVYYQVTRSFRSIEITPHSFVIKKGIFTTTADSIPFSKVTGIHIRRNLIQRLMGTASVGIDIVGPGIEYDLGTYAYHDADTIKKSLAEGGVHVPSD